MWTCLYVCAGGAAVLYVLYRLVVRSVQCNPDLALLWHDVILERILNRLTGSTRPQVGSHSTRCSPGNTGATGSDGHKNPSL